MKQNNTAVIDFLLQQGKKAKSKELSTPMEKAEEYRNAIGQCRRILAEADSSRVNPSIDIRGLKDSQNIYYPDTFVAIKELPKKLIVIGNGEEAGKFADAYRDFGTTVTLLNHQSGISHASVYDTTAGVTLTYTDNKNGLPYFMEADAIIVAAISTHPLQ